MNREYGPFTLVGHGDARGVDHHAFRWAKDRDIPWQLFVAHWTKEGDAAGPIRNGRMLRTIKPDLVIAFPGHTGTADCCMQAQAMHIKVLVIKQNHPPKGGLIDLVAKRKERVRSDVDRQLESGSKFFSSMRRYRSTGRKLVES